MRIGRNALMHHTNATLWPVGDARPGIGNARPRHLAVAMFGF
jgi:hypothetical protein